MQMGRCARWARWKVYDRKLARLEASYLTPETENRRKLGLGVLLVCGLQLGDANSFGGALLAPTVGASPTSETAPPPAADPAPTAAPDPAAAPATDPAALTPSTEAPVATEAPAPTTAPAPAPP